MFLILGSAGFSSSIAQDLSVEQVLSKHLASIGPGEVRQGITTLFAAGLSEFEAKTPVIKGGGKAVVVSDAHNLYFAMSLNSREYPFEKIGAFGNKTSLPFINSGSRSLLGSFLNEHPKILSDSLFCGAMSLRWIVDVAEKRKIKMRSGGVKKVDGRPMHVLDVLSTTSGAEDFKIRLFFDADNFRHIRSEYRRTVQSGRIIFGQQNQISDSRLDLTEEFSDFKGVDGLTLPHVYKVTFSSNSNSAVYESSWRIKVATYYLNQKLAPDFFTFDVKQ
ncbi:hypothetical protein BH20ACI2_BH20ACI2_14890 [soil metagenome]